MCVCVGGGGGGGGGASLFQYKLGFVGVRLSLKCLACKWLYILYAIRCMQGMTDKQYTCTYSCKIPARYEQTGIYIAARFFARFPFMNLQELSSCRNALQSSCKDICKILQEGGHFTCKMQDFLQVSCYPGYLQDKMQDLAIQCLQVTCNKVLHGLNQIWM